MHLGDIFLVNNIVTKEEKDFIELRDNAIGKKRIKKLLENFENGKLEEYLAPWYRQSRLAKHVYPSQGLLITPYDYLGCESFQMLPQETIVHALRLRTFFLHLFNHPYRIQSLYEVNRKKFVPVPKVASKVMESSIETESVIAIGDLGATITGSDKIRVSRTQRYASGPFVKLGKQARTYFVGSSMPDVWSSSDAIATMAASHCLTGIPRNALHSDIKRQVDLAKEIFAKLDLLAKQMLKGRTDKGRLLHYWKNNVMGTLEASPQKAMVRADALYKAGVRVFRVYSPEPGTGPVDTVTALRKKYKDQIEIFAGQVVDVNQAKELQDARADGLFVGIGGGGRCITGVRSGSVIDWPELVWKLRGEINIPLIAEGGASDHVAVTLLLGASGISVSRIVSGGTIESPGGALYCVGNNGKLFKPYGGEASARTKYLDGKLLPFDIPSFVEGETARAEINYVKHTAPTLTYNLHLLLENAVLSLVFRGVQDIHELHSLNPSPLRKSSYAGEYQANIH